MDVKYNVVWADTAEKDLINIIKYIAVDNPLNAKTILAKIKKQASDLYLMPERGRTLPELYEQGI